MLKVWQTVKETLRIGPCVSKTKTGRRVLRPIEGVVAQLAHDGGHRYNGAWHTTHTPSDIVFVIGVTYNQALIARGGITLWIDEARMVKKLNTRC